MCDDNLECYTISLHPFYLRENVNVNVSITQLDVNLQYFIRMKSCSDLKCSLIRSFPNWTNFIGWMQKSSIFFPLYEVFWRFISEWAFNNRTSKITSSQSLKISWAAPNESISNFRSIVWAMWSFWNCEIMEWIDWEENPSLLWTFYLQVHHGRTNFDSIPNLFSCYSNSNASYI